MTKRQQETHCEFMAGQITLLRQTAGIFPSMLFSALTPKDGCTCWICGAVNQVQSAGSRLSAILSENGSPSDGRKNKGKSDLELARILTEGSASDRLM